jgi:predicted AAA+ superfamily ATPase
MKRELTDKLQTWKDSPSRKPLILQGARQVGKTWLSKEFGRLSFERVAYFNFEENAHLASLFSGDLDIDRLLVGLRIESAARIEPGTTLIIFDEVQECPRALTSLKYFAENAPEYHIVAAGSLLGLAMHHGTSFPVGKVDFIDLFPLSFSEYLIALEESELARLLVSRDWKMIELFREKLTGHLRTYLCLGGMPEIVHSFIETRDMNQARTLQKKLLAAYEQDFSKYAEVQLVPRIRAIWKSIPAQLSREQKKFVYGLVREGARAREYKMALEWLCDAGLLHKVFRVSRPGVPLKAYQTQNAFKLYMLDVGLLAAHAGLPLQALLNGNVLFEEFKGALSGQYASQELRLQSNLTVSYWASDNSQAEVDFLLQDDHAVYPLEIKASENLQAKSLKSYRDRYSPLRSFRSSLSGYREESWLTNIPLYALSGLSGEVGKWGQPLQ